MDIEQRQSELIDHFVKQATAASNAPALTSVIVDATSHPLLFAFSEILDLPNVVQLEATDSKVYLDMLRLFAHGIWSDYKSNAERLPQLVPDQILKLKQLTVLTLAETHKVLPYDQLMQELDVTNVRELEDFLINECMYARIMTAFNGRNHGSLLGGSDYHCRTELLKWLNCACLSILCAFMQLWGIVRGKLDQLRRCLEVQFAAGRDLRPGQLGNMIQTLSNWLSTSENMLVSIQDKIKWADSMSEVDKKHRKDVEEKVDEVKKSLFKAILCNLKCLFFMIGIYWSTCLTYIVAEVTHCKQGDIDFRGHEEICSESGGVMDYEEDRSRPKR
ncbi:cop9 signalosome complex subunit 7-like protein [Trifolium pratense]|uniref:Cop9 signalosome complex subunit 7-like protein n=1 Tax=Trifolium pratense TaxID=57577 RepID=A0A2K3P3V4_TRIPR|nr:cop9 signalosome complex subunit 7-like protein [Trifolium pratense]